MNMHTPLLIALLQLFHTFKCINIRQGLFTTVSTSLDPSDHLQISSLYETDISTFKYKAQQYYKNIPIFGASLVFEHKFPNTNTNPKPIFGKYYNKNDIDSKLKHNTIPTISSYQALNITFNSLNISPDTLYGNHSIILYIYYYNNTPYLTYIIKFSYINNNIQYQPMIILDAHTGIIYKQYNNVKNFIDICGVGGNPKIGKVSYCGTTALQVNKGNNQNAPFLINHYVQIYDNNNMEFTDKLSSSLMQCSLNRTSNKYYISDRIINNGYCTGCDVFEFINHIFDMFKTYIGVLPVKDEHIPLKAYVHVGTDWDASNYDDINGAVNFGDGNGATRYPFSVIDIVGHEIGHGFTAKTSDLINADESGAINNAYADLIGEISEYFYYGANDWRIGVNSYILNTPNVADRFMDFPPLDGVSIDHYSDYSKGMNTYYSSGIYSKAIYLLNIQYNWSMLDIFKIFTRANELYWTNDIIFSDGVCALYESLNDFYGTNSTKILKMSSDITNAFNTVGVQCFRNQTVSICGDNKNTFCVYKEIIPSLTADQEFTTYLQLERNENGLDVNVTVFLTIRQNECKYPSISFEYEEIDLDNDWEWIIVKDYEGNVIEQCGNDWICSNWNTTCINDYKLGLSDILKDNTITFSISVPSDVGALCFEHDYILNAKLKLKCYLNTPSPTEPVPTISPITLSPTLPTSEPTIVTRNPTPFPTHVITDCNNDTHCYHIDVSPDLNNSTETIVKIQNIDEGINVYYQILFNISNNDCIDPRISFEYELIDYDLLSEFLAVYDNDGKELAICNGGSFCNQWQTCIFNNQLQSKILAGTIYNITIMESDQVDALCNEHELSVNAKLTLKCAGGTAEPSISPTTEPSLSPTLPTPAVPSFSPTSITATPTRQPTEYFYCDRKRNTLCYNVNVTPQPNQVTAFVASVKHEDTNVDTYYKIFFNIKDIKCVNPMLSFRYEQIDYDGVDEYLDVYNNDGLLIERCGNNTGDFACNVFDDCLTNYNLNENSIGINSTYEIMIFKPVDVNAQCPDTHLYAINVDVTLLCDSSSASPTLEPTLQPSLSPTLPTEIPTPAPTYYKQSCEENTYCIHATIHPISDKDTQWSILIENNNNNNTEATYFKVWVTSYLVDCVAPSITFEFERIDYESRNEYILISGSDNGFKTAQCGGDGVNNLCGVYDTCLLDTDLGINRIRKSDSYIFYLTQTAQIEPQCENSDMTMNARLTITCRGITATPTINPTKEPTAAPSLPTISPSYNPTETPTTPSNAPTLQPTHDVGPCHYDTRRYCLYENIYPADMKEHTSEVTIQNPDIGDDIVYDIYFTPRLFPCITPFITFIYEPIDYDQDYEYLNITDRNGKLITKCFGKAFECGTFAHCLPNYFLGKQKININASDMITITQTAEVGALCFDHDFALNAKLSITCHNDRANSLVPTTAPTPEPTALPTIDTLPPSPVPSEEPTFPTLSPSPAPTHETITCGLNTFCIYVDLYPDLDTLTSYDVPIIHNDINAELQFNVIFSVKNRIECVSPDISYNFELIDYDGRSEYINITDNNNRELQKCGAVSFGQECGRFIDCFVNRPIGVNKIGLFPLQYKIGVNVGAEVDSLCNNHFYSVNSVLTLRCSGGSAAPTSDPTTAKPTIATSNPSESPSQQPTQMTSPPTPKPTWHTYCDPFTNTWCYDVDLQPLFIADTIWTVPLQYDDSISFPNTNIDSVTLKISYHVSGIAENDCVEPTLSLIYETIDYDAAFEWMNVSEPGRTIKECGVDNPKAECGVFETCFKDFRLKPSKIIKDATYEITIYQPADVDSLCSQVNNPYALNATLILKCFGGTANPSTKPTNQPSNSPTIPTLSPTTPSPTDITLNPTPSPTYTTVDCTPQTGGLEQTFCIYVDMYPIPNVQTSYTAEIQTAQPLMIGNTIFDVIFTPNGADCIDPTLTFIFEKIDYDEYDEYINISDRKGLITQCGGSGSNRCRAFDTCLNQTSFNKIKIGEEDQYKISVTISTEVDALCFDHDYIVNAKITMFCNIGTALPSQQPTPEPTPAPSQITVNPTPMPTGFPTVPTDQPTLSPTFRRHQCNFFPNTWCYYVDIEPIDNEISEYSLWIQGEDDGQETHFEVKFNPLVTDCINPTITLIYENIDFDGPNEYIEIFDNNNKLIKNCGGWYKCDTFSTCIKNYELMSNSSVKSIKAGENYTISIVEQDEVDGLCEAHTYTTNAKLTLKCNNKEEEEVIHPDGSLCGKNKYCFKKLMYPKPMKQTVWQQEIYHSNNINETTGFSIDFISINERCYLPQLQFIYERIDFDDPNEFIEIYNNNTQLIERCGAGKLQNECGSFDICLKDNYPLGIDYIEMSDIYTILLFESRDIYPLCNNHSYSINAIVTITCQTRPTIISRNFSYNIPGSFNAKDQLFERLIISRITDLQENEQEFNLFFNAIKYDCLNPRITISTQIKTNTKYAQDLIIYDNNLTRIGKCVSWPSAVCPRSMKCIENYYLFNDINSMGLTFGNTYKFTMYQMINLDPSFDKWCDESDYTIKIHISFYCQGIPTIDPTINPTITPTTINPTTNIPTTIKPTNNPIIKSTNKPTSKPVIETTVIKTTNDNNNNNGGGGGQGHESSGLKTNKNTTIAIAIIVIILLSFCCVCFFITWYKRNKKKKGNVEWSYMTEMQENNRLKIIPGVDGTEGDDRPLTMPTSGGYDERPLHLETIGENNESDDEDIDYGNKKTKKGKKKKKKKKKNKKYAQVITSPSGSTPHDGDEMAETDSLVNQK